MDSSEKQFTKEKFLQAIDSLFKSNDSKLQREGNNFLCLFSQTPESFEISLDVLNTPNLIDEAYFNASQTNEIVRCRVEDIAEHINACLDACPHQIPKNIPVFVTGGTFAYLKGGINELSKCLEKAVYPAPINSPQYDKQEYTSAYGLISIALSQNKPVKKSFFKKLLENFRG